MCYWYKGKLKRLLWSLLYFFTAFTLSHVDYVCAIRKGTLMVPLSYTALSGDLHVQLQYKEPPLNIFNTDLSLEISKLKNNKKDKIEIINIYPDPRNNITQISIPCHTFFLGGSYEFEIIENNVNNTLVDNQQNNDDRITQQLDVRWPIPKLNVSPEQIGTYPEETVNVILSFPEIECKIKNIDNPELPEFWLELIYCGQEIVCANSNGTNSQHILYAEQIRGFIKTKLIKLRCEYFGLAGHYMIQLRPVQPTPSFVSAFTYIRADWNEKFVFNVHARSIFPCDPHSGVSVLFEYPPCILDQADRVRLFAKLRADVASLKPPTSLHYVTEQKVKRGQHSLHFDCDYFSEKYIEYCFVYVSQAISGAVADIRMDCVPTLPVSDSDTGGWGPWSEWTPCSTTCSGGTKNRYRFCDSPPPRYGAKFCEGPAVETQYCGKKESDTWDCIYGVGVSGGKSSIVRSEIAAEVGPGCRCGCIVHLGSSKPKRVIASSAQSCPGRSFWLIQADENYKIDLIVDFSRLPCSTQYVKIRDGDSLRSDLIFQNNGGTKFRSESITSAGNQVLVEFFSDEIASIDKSCNGGFLAHVQQIAPEKQNITSISSRAITQKSKIGLKFTAVHIAAVIFASIIIIISALLGTQYILRYRKYHLTESMGEPDSPIHTPRASIGSLQNPDNPPSRAVSTNTLLSEVIYLVKVRPRGRMKHSILRESVDGEALEKETNLNDESKELKCDDSGSVGSTHTLTNETVNETHNQDDKEVSSCSINDNISINSKQSISNFHETTKNENKTTKRNLPSVSDTESNKSIQCKRNFLSASHVTLTNGCYSPASSIISTATIRTTNQKESKEKLNRERLARPDSEFSLANPEDLELDYYDYNVVNAGAAPGSYLGMDPAYLVWIPPLDDGNIINEVETNTEPHYEEILPNFNDIDPGSNTETPESDIVPEPPPMLFTKKLLQDNNETLKSISTQKKDETLKFKQNNSLSSSSSLLSSLSSSSSSKNKCKKNPENESIQMEDLSEKYNKLNVITKTFIINSSNSEKETAVVKSPSDLQDYYELDDIQFADEEETNEIIENNKTTNVNVKPTCNIKT